MRVLVFGTFDGLHPGHRFVLDQASARGDPFVVIGRDVTVQAIKGKAPKQSEQERARAIREAYPSATVLLGDLHDYLAPVREADPDLILLGYDQKLPPGIADDMLPCPVERLPGHRPDLYKSSIVGAGS